MKWEELFENKISSFSDLDSLVKSTTSLIAKKSIIVLQGPMGVGKTEFVKRMGFHFQSETVASPTFAIHHRYASNRGVIDHLDLYRLQNEDELETTGFWDFLSSEEGLIFIEWPERINLEHLPLDWQLLKLEFEFSEDTDPQQRIVKAFKRL